MASPSRAMTDASELAALVFLGAAASTGDAEIPAVNEPPAAMARPFRTSRRSSVVCCVEAFLDKSRFMLILLTRQIRDRFRSNLHSRINVRWNLIRAHRGLSGFYSSRNATIGSTLLARHAGMTVAASATTASNA